MRAIESLLAGLLGLAAVAASPLGRAEVTASGPSGFSLKTELTLAAKPDDAFTRFLRIGSWWSDAHTYSGKAVNMTLDAKPGGCFCERLPRGGFVKHMDVLFSAPGKGLRLGGGLGPLQDIGANGVLALTFKPEGEQTHLTMTYSVSGFAAGNRYPELAPLVDQVLTEQMARFKQFVDTGKPTG